MNRSLRTKCLHGLLQRRSVPPTLMTNPSPRSFCFPSSWSSVASSSEEPVCVLLLTLVLRTLNSSPLLSWPGSPGQQAYLRWWPWLQVGWRVLGETCPRVERESCEVRGPQVLSVGWRCRAGTEARCLQGGGAVGVLPTWDTLP